MPERVQDAERLARALATLLGPAAARIEPRKLADGIGHASYLVTLAEQSYVLKLKHGPAPAILTLEEEFALLEAAAAAGITAEPLRMDSATDAMLIRFVPRARSLTEAVTRESANISRLAALLHRLHGMAAPLRDFEPRGHAENYLSAAARWAPLTPREQGMAKELRTLAADYATRYPPSAVCHNDLVAANVLDTGELVLVDFEYAARAAPILDLASLAAMNAYTENDRRKLLSAYYGGSAAPVSPAELADVVRLVQLITYFWALALPAQLRAQNARYLRV